MDNRNDFQKKIGVGEPSNAFPTSIGTSRKVIIKREDDGNVGGVSTEHWDGSNDVTVMPYTRHLIKDSKTGDITTK